jgi:hypothetical protein
MRRWNYTIPIKITQTVVKVWARFNWLGTRFNGGYPWTRKEASSVKVTYLLSSQTTINFQEITLQYAVNSIDNYSLMQNILQFCNGSRKFPNAKERFRSSLTFQFGNRQHVFQRRQNPSSGQCVV